MRVEDMDYPGYAPVRVSSGPHGDREIIWPDREPAIPPRPVDDRAEQMAKLIAERNAERQEFRAAFVAVNRQLHRTRTERHLDALAFAAAVLRRRGPEHTPAFAHETQQYLMLYEAKRAQLARPLQTHEAEELHAASRALWAALHTEARAAA